jgi:alpha-tubulin suppressor-like RCC1 family protein
MEQYTEVFAWGLDTKGQLGLGAKNSGKCYTSPRFCSYNIMIKDISCGEDHSGFISDSGHVYCMGSNSHGKLGIGDKSISYSASPCLVESLSSHLSTKISCGWGHTAILTSQNLLFTWGLGQYGALGTGNLEDQWSPIEIAKNISEVSCGSRHMGAISEYKVLICGSGDAGQLGTGKRQRECELVHLAIENIVQISCGEFHTGLVNQHGELFMMGGNSFGQLGIGHKKSSSIPVKVEINNVLKVACGNHSACVTSEGFYVWGSCVFGEFVSPKKVRVSRNSIVDIAVGGSFGVAVDAKHKVFAWGCNNNGELAQGDFQSRSSAVQVQALKGKKVRRLAAGGGFCVCLGEDTPKTDQKHIKTQSIGLSARDFKSENHEIPRLIELLHEEKQKYSNLVKEYEDLHKAHIEFKESTQGKIQESNLQYQQISSESFKIKDSLTEIQSQLQLLKSENSYLKDENLRFKKLQDTATEKIKLEIAMNKLKETHFLEIQELQAQLEKEKVLKKQVERDLEVASSHRHRMEQALSEAHKNFETQYIGKVKEFEDKISEILEEKANFQRIYDKVSDRNRILEEDILIMHGENKFYCENTREMHYQQEKLQGLVKQLQNANNSLTASLSEKDRALESLDNEIRGLKMQTVEVEKRNQECLADKERELANRAKEFKDKTNFILTPKVPLLKNILRDEGNDEVYGSARVHMANTPKSLISVGMRLGENVFPSCNDPNDSSPNRKSPEGFGTAESKGHFTFRKAATPSKEDVKAKIAALMQNRSRIEKKLKILQNEQETL